jgi:hypothetical protein
MDLAETEVEISGDFRQLPPDRQDCVLETARALFWAARSLENQPAGNEPGPNRPAVREGI